MCGIFGFVGDRRRAEAIDLSVAVKALRHRGPDDNGTYLSVSPSDHDVACVFAQTRLSIIDLSAAGHQPMTTEDGRFTIVYNGEVYNFRELRSALSREGYRFTSDTDTEVVLKAYAAWGKYAVERFRGMFAFAVWDAKESVLFFARDRFGVKPFYYVTKPGSFAFGSEVRALLETGLAERSLSRKGMASYLLFGSVYDPWTLAEGVRALLPAHRGEVRDGEISIGRYWDLPVETTPMMFDEAVERVRPSLREAVASELVSDVPLGIFLSGGVDSSALVAFAAEAATKSVHTFTVTFDEEQYNEERYAAAIAAHFGCDHHQVHLPASKVHDEFESICAAADQPSADGVNTYVVSRAAREAGLVVALSGLGGDELFGGYRTFRSFATLMRVGSVARWLPGRIARLVGGVDAFNGRAMWLKKMGEILAARGSSGTTYAVMRAMFTPSQAAHLAPELRGDINEVWDGYAGVEGGADSIADYSRLELTNYLRNTLLRDSDAMSMANALELRVPLLDHLLAETVLPIPGPLKMAPGVNKPILAAATPRLSPDIARRSKMGFTLPLDAWCRGPLKPRCRDIFLMPWVGPDVISQTRLQHVWDTFLGGGNAVSVSRAWSLMMLKEWCVRNGMAF